MLTQKSSCGDHPRYKFLCRVMWCVYMKFDRADAADCSVSSGLSVHRNTSLAHKMRPSSGTRYCTDSYNSNPENSKSHQMALTQSSIGLSMLRRNG